MRVEEMPEFQDEEEQDEWYNRPQIGMIDHNVYDTLDSLDRMLEPYGLEVVYWSQDPEAPFSIEPRK